MEKEVAIVRLEELCPFPFESIKATLEPFFNNNKNSSGPRIVWAQEESQNQGAWPHVMPRLASVLKDMGESKEVFYVGRDPREVPAVGVGKMHAAEVERIMKGAFE